MSKFNPPTILRSNSNEEVEFEVENNDMNIINGKYPSGKPLQKHISFPDSILSQYTAAARESQGIQGNQQVAGKKQLNEQPQDYVVTNGKVYKLNKSSISSELSPRGGLSDSMTKGSLDLSKKLAALTLALEEANSKVKQQDDIIQKQALTISKLSAKLKEFGIDYSMDDMEVMYTPPGLPALKSQSSVTISTKVSKSRSKISNALHSSNSSFSSRTNALSFDSIESPCQPCHSTEIENVTVYAIEDMSNADTPTDSPTTELVFSSSKSKLASRLSLSVKERRKMRSQARESPKLTSDTSISSPILSNITSNDATLLNGTKFINSFNESQYTLYVAHDNPTLKYAIYGSSNGNISTEVSMEFLLETKINYHSKEETCFVFGKIKHCGSYNEYLSWRKSRSASAVVETCRGSEVLIVQELSIITCVLNDASYRIKGVIHEINLHEKMNYVEKLKVESINDIFMNCTSKVDIILNPTHDSEWYPYYESTSSSSNANSKQDYRKLPPQFRSKGIGYLRLGDDMSRYGSSFLSLDGFRSYLDFGKANVDLKNISKSSLIQSTSLDYGSHDQLMSVNNSPLPPTEVRESVMNQLSLLVTKLSTENISWKEQADLLTNISHVLTSSSESQTKVPAKLDSVLMSTLIKQLVNWMNSSNVVVMKAVFQLIVIVLTHYCPTTSTSNSELEAGFTTLLSEAIPLVKNSNKTISEVADKSLVTIFKTNPGLLSRILSTIDSLIHSNSSKRSDLPMKNMILWLRKLVIECYNPALTTISSQTEMWQLFIEKVMQSMSKCRTNVKLKDVVFELDCCMLQCLVNIQSTDILRSLDTFKYFLTTSKLSLEGVYAKKIYQNLIIKSKSKDSPDSPSTSTVSTTTSSVTMASYSGSTRGKLSQEAISLVYEVSLVLKSKFPNSTVEYLHLKQFVEKTATFFDELVTYAHQNGYTITSLIRELLPFNESTSSNDQSLVTTSINKTRHDENWYHLRELAVAIRKYIRIKMSDEADIQQASHVMKQLSTLCRLIDEMAVAQNIPTVEVLNQLHEALK